MSKYADIEQITAVIRTEWVKYIPMELDVNLSFVLGKISEVPTIEVSEDCISREWLLKAMDAEDVGTPDEMWRPSRKYVELIKHAPSVTTEQSSKVGEWLRKDGRVWSECSVCGSGSSFETKFCGNCGAKMGGSRDNDL